MQQRRVRLGDVLDDYCPRERRITNHAVVAMIEDEVKQTRCTTCDAEHEYKHARVPSPRRKKPVAAAVAADPPAVATEEVIEDPVEQPPDLPAQAMSASGTPDDVVEAEEAVSSAADDEWPVHRPLIRATLPRPEGQAPERKPTDFTLRQNGTRFDGQRNGNRSRGNRQSRQAQGYPGQSRAGNARQGSAHSPRQGGHGNQQRHGNRQGPSPGQRSGRPGQGSHRPGRGRGPKRGR
jgi:hypothetical protein